jgi:hypothetical protein
MKQPLNEQFRRMQKLAGILNENEENAKPSSITIAFNNGDKFMEQYKTGDEFTYHAKGLANGNYSKLQNGELELENSYYYPMFRCVTDSEKFRESKFKLGAYVIYLSYSKENNEIAISTSNKFIDITSSNSPDKFKNLADATNNITKFEKLEAGKVDDRGYFKIISVK